MTGRSTRSMVGAFSELFLKKYASKFYDAVNSRDIKKIIRWLERKYRDVIVPYAEDHPIIVSFIEEPLGKKIGELLGDYFVDRYEALSLEEKKKWNSDRWLHHGALGELIFIRGIRKHNSFFIGLGNGLMGSDAQDRNNWHTPEYEEALNELRKMK